MKHSFNLQNIARLIKAAQDESGQIEPLTSRYNDFGEAAAYDAALLVHQARLKEGAIPVGRKIGFTNPAMWSLYGVNEPIWAYVYDRTVVHLTAPDTTCHIGRFTEPKIEPEIVIHFRSTPPVTDDLTKILACVDWIAHGIEIVQSHFPGWKFQAADTIADWGLHATLLVGKPVVVEQLGTDAATVLEHFTVTLSCNGTIREVGKGANALGSPLTAIAHLLAVLAKRQQSTLLQANELVTTGTLTPALPIQTGEMWSTDLSDIALPGISVLFVA